MTPAAFVIVTLSWAACVAVARSEAYSGCMTANAELCQIFANEGLWQLGLGWPAARKSSGWQQNSVLGGSKALYPAIRLRY